jgi:hypothetical protein
LARLNSQTCSEVGAPLVAVGSRLQLAGVGLQVYADLKQSKNENAAVRGTIELGGKAASRVIEKAVDISGVDKVAGKAIEKQGDLIIKSGEEGAKQKNIKQ